MQNNINEWENENTEIFESGEYISDDDLGTEDDEFEDSDEDEYSEEDYEDDEEYEEDESDESDEVENADENNNGMKKKIIAGSVAAVLLLLLIGGGFAGVHLMKKHAANSNVANVEEAQDINAGETVSVNSETVVDENGEELSVINIENEDASEQKTAENPVLPSDENGIGENEVAKTDNSSLEIEDTPKPVKMDNGLDIDDVKVSIGDVGRKNPFVPFSVDKSSAVKSEDIIQTSSIGFDVIEPPSLAEVNPEISKLFSTKVSGILYDEIRPSAILNIDGFDQLVRIGDTLGEFSILNITKNKVVIKSGVNVYRASVGQPLNAEKVVTSAEISNLEHKFYGSNKK